MPIRDLISRVSTATCLFCLAGMASSVGFGQVTFDFDTATEWTGNFSTSSASPLQWSSSVGLNGGGGIDLTPLNSNSTQIWTFNTPYTSATPTVTASFYLNATSNNGIGGNSLWMMGITDTAAPAQEQGYPYGSGAYLPTIYFQSGTTDEGTVGWGNYHSGLADGTEWQAFTEMASDLTNRWYYYSITINYIGSDTYETTGSVTEANSDGSLGALLGTSSATFSNPALAGSPETYFYFAVYDGTAIDQLTINAVPEPSTYAAIGGAASLLAAMVYHRRRKAVRL